MGAHRWPMEFFAAHLARIAAAAALKTIGEPIGTGSISIHLFAHSDSDSNANDDKDDKDA